MRARLIEKSPTVIDDTSFFRNRFVAPAHPLPGSAHPFKYRLAFMVNGKCILRYDNERAKGDHRHIEDVS